MRRRPRAPARRDSHSGASAARRREGGDVGAHRREPATRQLAAGRRPFCPLLTLQSGHCSPLAPHRRRAWGPGAGFGVVLARALYLYLLPALLLLSPAIPPLRALDRDSPEGIFAQGNGEYQRGDFTAAERAYQELLERGVDSGALYYNLGNVFFKQKKLGEAIYYWEKAQRKLPRDPDVRENLELANLMVVDRVEVPSDPYPLRILNRLQELLPVNQAAWTVLSLFVVANLLFSVYLLAGNPRLCLRALAGALIAAALVLILGSTLSWRIYAQSSRVEGVVIEQKADVRSGPGMDNITVFTVHEGIKVLIRGETGGWYQVSLPNGWNGWLQASALRIL